MKNKKSKLFNLLVWIFVLIVIFTFILTYPGLAKDTGKALAKTTGLVVGKVVDMVKGSDTVREAAGKAVNRTIEIIG